MISVEKARELMEIFKRRKLEEFKALLEKEKFSETIKKRANMGYHNTSFVIRDEYLTVATEYFNELGFAVSYSPRYSNQREVEISW